MQRTTAQNPTRRRALLLQNVLWFGASLILAILVWMVANPIEEESFLSIPVEVLADPDMLVVQRSLNATTVIVRAQSRVMRLLTAQDITVQVDLRGRPAGTYTVELRPQIARRAATDTQPRRITVTLEALDSKLVEVQADIIGDPPLGFQRDTPIFADPQVLVSGPSSRVSMVAAARVTVDLRSQRTTLTQTLAVTPVNDQGEVVSDVTVEPASVEVTVPINRREDVREVSITPNIATSSLPAGYIITSLGYEPQTVFVSGNLSQIPETLFTQRITLEDRTEYFEITVPVVLPSRDLLLLGPQEITVSVGISALTITRTFENIPITVIGLETGLTAQLVTNQVTVLITGPQVTLDALDEGDLQVVLDLNDLEPDTYDLTPIVSNSLGPLDSASVSVLPDTITVSITPAETATPTPRP